MKEYKGVKILDDTSKMGNYDMSLNMAYLKDGYAQYRDFEDEMSLTKLSRLAAEARGQSMDDYSDEEIDELMSEWSVYGESEIKGQIALLYWSICGMAVYRELTKELIDKNEELEQSKKLLDAITFTKSQMIKTWIFNDEWHVEYDNKTLKLIDWYEQKEKEGK